MKFETAKLKDISIIKTGKLDSNAALPNGKYPFFTCDPQTLNIDVWAYDTEAVLLAGNNASGNYTAKYYNGKFNAYQRTYIIESVDKNKLNTRYLCYAMNLKLSLLKTMSSGSTTKFLTIKMLHGLDIPFPSIEKQNHISQILSNYDNLIENNQKQIKLLEEAAQRIYKEWFVDLHFPGYESTTITDGVPEGWIKKNLSDVAILKAGGDRPKNFSKYKTDKYNVPVYSNGAESEGLYGYTDKASVGEQCITVSARGNVGYTCLRRTPFVPIVRLIAITPKTINVEYLYFYLKNMNFESNGAAQQQITVPMIKDKVVLIPPTSLLNAFTKVLSPMFEQIDNIRYRIENTTEARDRLLPKLMSGEIEV